MRNKKSKELFSFLYAKFTKNVIIIIQNKIFFIHLTNKLIKIIINFLTQNKRGSGKKNYMFYFFKIKIIKLFLKYLLPLSLSNLFLLSGLFLFELIF